MRAASLLGEHIKRALPRIASELDGTTRSTKAELAALGEDEPRRLAQGEARHVVLACAKKFDGLVDGAVALAPAAAGDAARGALAGGARVEATFKALRQALDARTVESAMSFDELFTLVENARGLAPGGWDTDAPLRALICWRSFVRRAVRHVRRVRSRRARRVGRHASTARRTRPRSLRCAKLSSQR